MTKKELYKTALMTVEPKGYVRLDSYDKISEAYWVTAIDGSKYFVWEKHLTDFVL